MMRIFFISFVVCVLMLWYGAPAFAGLEQAEVFILKGDYDTAIKNCNEIISSPVNNDTPGAYCLKGRALLAQNKIIEAQDIFNKVLTDFSSSRFCDIAQLGLADTYFAQEDYGKAIGEYRKLEEKYKDSRLNVIALYKLGKASLKEGDMQQARFYFQKLQQEYPMSFESKLVDELDDRQFSYSVQVGCFSKYENAEKQVEKLKKQGFKAYVSEKEGFPVFYRVRVGNFKTESQTQACEISLRKKGYKTKTCP